MQRWLAGTALACGVLAALSTWDQERRLPRRILTAAQRASEESPGRRKVALWREAKALAESSARVTAPVRFSVSYGLASALRDDDGPSADAEFEHCVAQLVHDDDDAHLLSDVQRVRLASALDHLAQAQQDRGHHDAALALYLRALDACATPDEVRLGNASALASRGALDVAAGILNNLGTLLEAMRLPASEVLAHCEQLVGAGARRP